MCKKVYLIDGSSYVFRAYYAVAPLSTSSGFPTNALLGFLRMLIKLLDEVQAEHIAMIFDAGRETFRNELYPEYKANRGECPDDLREQMPFFREFSRALGLPVFELVGFEADDVIATLSNRLHALDCETVIVSGDKDLLQLVGPGVRVWDTMKDVLYGEQEVQAKMGVGPEKVVELLGLMGDSSDNIPGVRGVGPKTAIQLIEQFGTVENVVQSTDIIRETKGIRGRLKIADTIEANPELVRLSRVLVEVKKDVPVSVLLAGKTLDHSELEDNEILQALERGEVQLEALSDLAERFEMQSLYKAFALKVSKAKVDYRSLYKTVTRANFDTWAQTMQQQPLVAFDIESTSLDTLEAEIVGFSFCWSAEEAWYLPVAHRESAIEQVSIATVLDTLREWFENKEKHKMGQNCKYDMELLMRVGIQVRGVYFDSMLGSYLLNPDKGSHSLDALASEFLGRSLITFSEALDGRESFADVPIETATAYAGEDAHVVWLLFEHMQPLLEEAELWSVLSDIEVPLIAVLATMEMDGISLDVKFLQEMSQDLEQKLKESEQKIYELAGEEFNPNSPKQLSVILFEKLGISTRGVKKTKTGYSTDSSVLDKLSQQHALPKQILDHRVLHKLKSTYVDALPAVVSQSTQRVHTRFNQTITATGRLSSSDPNLQNIPIQRPEGRKVRKAFIAKPGAILISADYSQIELRVLAHMSGDASLQDAFLQDRDIHAQTAREILGLQASEDLTPEQRRMGKTINFGIVYGMSGFRLARDLGIPVAEASRYINDYFARYPGVRSFFDSLESSAENPGFVTTLFGRRRYLSALQARGRDQGFAKRVAINAPIQGTAADVMKLAMISLAEAIPALPFEMAMLLQIHDELVFECDVAAVEEAKVFIREKMESVVALTVPLRVDIGSGSNWYEAH